MLWVTWGDLLLGIENLDRFIFMINNWPSDVDVGCDGPLKLKAMAKFLEKDYSMLENTIN